jgi:type I restriction enzyme S subunit
MSRHAISTDLPDICSLVTDGTHDSPKLQSSGVPFIKGKHISSGHVDFETCDFITEEDHLKCIKRVKPQVNDVLFANIGSVGDVARVVDERDFSIKNVALFRPDPAKVDPTYFYYLVLSPTFRGVFLNVRSGAAQPFISLDAFRSHRFPFNPDKAQQHKVGIILSAYDDLIENNRRRMALLEEAARQLYREWFVRLRFPGHEHTRITNGVPEGLERKRLGEMAYITMGQSPESTYYNEHGEGLPFHQGVTDFGDRFVSHRIYCNALNRIAEAGDILCSVRAPVGRLNVTLDRIVIGRGLSALRSKTANQSFLFQQLRAHFFKEDLIGSGAIFASVTKKEFESQDLMDPPERLKRAFEDVIVPCDEQLRVLHLQNEKLRAARNLLLPRLMSGGISV